MSALFWILKLKAFFHDPPDKALKIQGHETRADNILSVLMRGINYIPPDIDDVIKDADHMVSSLQRISVQVKSSSGERAEPVIDFSSTGKSEFEWNNKIYVRIWGKPLLLHPVTGEIIIDRYSNLTERHIEFTKNMSYKTAKTIASALKPNEEDPEKIFIISWRFFKDYMKRNMMSGIADMNRIKEVLNLPADTRSPDHTIWEHMDLVSAVAGAMYNPDNKKRRVMSLIALKITPVQDFIKNARKMKDLWAGSHMLSLITFIGITKIIDKWGPDAIIFPYLRGQPFLDLYYVNKYGSPYKKMLSSEGLKELEKKAYVANIPNIALGIIGIDDTEKIGEIEKKYEKEIRDEINKFLKNLLTVAMKNAFDVEDVKNEYQEILENYFNVTVSILPIYPIEDPEEFLNYVKEILPEGKLKEKYNDWLETINNLGTYGINKLDLYSLAFEILMHLLSLKSKENLQKNKVDGSSGDKCTMCGEFVAMEEFKKEEYKEKEEYRRFFKEREKLCPVCLAKRYYPEYISTIGWNGIRVDKDEVKIESVSEIAMKSGIIYGNEFKSWWELFPREEVNKIIKKWVNADFVNKEIYYVENITSEGLKKLGYPSISEDTCDKIRKFIESKYPKYRKVSIPPPNYYALLVMDGDNMGMVLNGDLMQSIKKYIHPVLIEYVGENLREYLERQRLLTPTTHTTISKSLMNFSVRKVKDIIDARNGNLIYSGGDDVFALLPRDAGVDAAYAVKKEFAKVNDTDYEILPNLNMSAGLLIVHYKYPLYAAVDKVRVLEKRAKSVSGKNSLAIGFLERSGNYYEVIVDWNIFNGKNLLYELMEYLYNARYFENANVKLSPRFIYSLMDVLSRLGNSTDFNTLYDLFIYQFKQHTTVKDGKLPKVSKDKLRKVLKMIKFVKDEEKSDKLRLQKLLILMKICLENNACRGEPT